MRQRFLLSLSLSLCIITVNSSSYSFALFWPQSGAAAAADGQFRDLFRSDLAGLCRSRGVELPADFGVSFEEFHLPSRPSLALLSSYSDRLSNGSSRFQFAGITSASPEARRLIEAMSSGGPASPASRWQLHSVDPPPLSVLAPSIARVVRRMQNPLNITSADAGSIDSTLAIIVGPPYSFSDVQSLLRSMNSGAVCFAIDSSGDWGALFDNVWMSGATTILVLANRTDTVQVVSGGLDGSLWSPDYRWILYDSAMIYDVKENLMPTNSRNITSLEFGPYSSVEGRYLETIEDVMLHDLLAIWTAYMANRTCGVRMADPLQVTGLTGVFNLSANGTVARHDWRMTVYRNLLTDAYVVGNFSTLGEFNFTGGKPRSGAWEDILTDYRRLNLSVYVIPGSQYVRYKRGMENRTDVPLRLRLEGMAFDLCMEVLDNLGLKNLTVVLQSDATYGALTNGQWSGIVASLIEGVADIACVDLTPTTARKEVIDFTVSYLRSNLSILYKSNTKDATKEMFQFLYPFSSQTWLCMCVALVGVAVVLAILHRISPNRQLFDLRYSLFFSFASLVQGVVGRPPDRPSGRLVVTAYWLFVTLLLVAYVGNYAAIRTLARLEVEITTVSSLLDQTTYTYGTLANSSLSSLFKESTFTDMRQVYERMRRFKYGLFTDLSLAKAAVKQGTFALIYDTPTTGYLQQLICDSVVTGYFENIDMAFGLPQRSDLKPIMDYELQKLLKSGRATQLFNKYFITPDEDSPECNSSLLTSVIPLEPAALQPKSGALTLQNTLGLLVINVLGCCITLIAAGSERACIALRRSRLKKMALQGGVSSRRRRSTIVNTLWLESVA